MIKYLYDDNGKKIGELVMYDEVSSSSGKKIVFVVGHDMKERGAYGSEGVSEWNFNDELMADLIHEDRFCKNHEYYVFYRSADLNGYTRKIMDLHERIDALGADISIELHFNSFSNESANGHEVLYCSEAGKAVASVLDTAFDKHLGNSDRGIKKVTETDRGGKFCCNGKSIAIISEPFFGAHQRSFVQGGSMRAALKQALVDFTYNV